MCSLLARAFGNLKSRLSIPGIQRHELADLNRRLMRQSWYIGVLWHSRNVLSKHFSSEPSDSIYASFWLIEVENAEDRLKQAKSGDKPWILLFLKKNKGR